MNNICSKIAFKLNLGLVLFIHEDHLSKNRFLSKLSENGQFSLNKVQKITNNQNFFIKSKLLRICGFHINSQFPAKKDSQGTSRGIWPTPGIWPDLALGRVSQESQRIIFEDLNRSHHVCLSVNLVYRTVSTFWTQPTAYCSKNNPAYA